MTLDCAMDRVGVSNINKYTKSVFIISSCYQVNTAYLPDNTYLGLLTVLSVNKPGGINYDAGIIRERSSEKIT